jgi:hypothetical protein
MTPAERKYAKQVDEQILNASGDELRRLQELDHQTQLKGESFYEVLAENPKNKEVPFGVQKSSAKKQP